MAKYSYILNLALILLFVVAVKNCSSNSSSLDSYVEFSENERNEVKKSVNLQAETIDLQAQIIMSQNDATKKLHKDLEAFKKVKALVKTEYITIASDIQIEYIHDTLSLTDTIWKSAVPKGSKVLFKDEWITFSGTLGDKFIIDTLLVFNKFDMVIGEKKVGRRLLFFTKWEPVVQVSSYSPYTKQAYMNNVIFEPSKGKKRLNNLSKGLAFGLGIFIGSKLN